MQELQIKESHIRDIDLALKNLHSAVTKLANDEAKMSEEMIRIIHFKGWTTPAEHLFTKTIIEDLTAQVHQVSTMQHALLESSRLVGKVTATVP